MTWRIPVILDVKKNTYKGIKVGLINSVISVVLQFTYRTVLIRYMGKEYLGLHSLFASVFQFLSLSELGIGLVIVQMMYQYVADDNKDMIGMLLNTYRKFLLAVSAFILSVGAVLIPAVPQLIKGKEYPDGINIYVLYILYLLNLSLGYGIFAYRSAVLSATQRIDAINLTTLIVNVLTFIFQTAVIVIFHDYYFVVLVMLVLTVFKNLLNHIFARRLFPEYAANDQKPDQDTAEKIKKNITALFGQRLFGTVVCTSDTITISAFIGLISLSAYSNYVCVLNNLMALLVIFINTLLPGIGHLLISKAKEDNYQDFLNITFAYNLIVSWCAVCLAGLFQNFICIWMGDGMVLSNRTMILLVAYFYLWKIKDTLSMYKDAAGIWWDDRYRPYICAAVNIVLNIVLVHFMGVDGVIIATIISDFCISFPWIIRVMKKRLFDNGLKEYFLMLAKGFLVTVLITGIIYYICNVLIAHSLLMMAVKMVICVVLPAVFYLICYHRSSYFTWMVGLVKNRLRQR